MIAPYRHEGEFGELTSEEAVEVHRLASAGLGLRRDDAAAGVQPRLESRPDRGAGVVDHVHLHVVPRWAGDTNFMPVLADVKVLPEALSDARQKLAEAWLAG